MGLRKKHRQVVSHLIKIDDINKLKAYIEKNLIVMRLLEYGGSHPNAKYINFLIYAIEHNSSFEMLKFIIDECQYETINFFYKEYGTPLFYAIKNKKFQIANFLMDNGALINIRFESENTVETKGFFYYFGINTIDCNMSEKKSDIIQNVDDCIHYLLNNNFNFSTEVINELIKYNNNNNNNYILEFILNVLVNNKGYSLNYKTRKTLKEERQQDDNIIKEKSIDKIIIIDNKTIEIAIKKKNFEALNIIWFFLSIKNEVMLIYWIYDFFPYKSEEIKNDFLEAFKNKKLKISNFIEENQLNNILNLFEIRADIMKWIKEGQFTKLKRYIQKKKISPNLIQNNKVFPEDILIYAVKVNAPITIINFLIEQYFSLNYVILVKKDDHHQPIKISPLSVAIQYENFKVVDILLKIGADINYSFNDHYENILDYLYEHHLANSKNFYYLLNYNSNHLILSSNLLNKLIRHDEKKIIHIILNYYPFNNQFILNLLSSYKNRVAISDQDLKEKLNFEKNNKIKINQSVYETAYRYYHPYEKDKEDDFNEILAKIINYDQRDDTTILMDLLNVLRFADNSPDKMNELINIIKKQEMKKLKPEKRRKLSEALLLNTTHIEEKRKIVKEKIKQNDHIGLKNYILKNNIILMSLNDNYHDLLIDAIEDETSLSMIEFLISQYSSLNYVVYYTTVDQNSWYKPFKFPLLSSLMMNNFEVADVLLLHGAEINFRYHDETVLYYLYYYYNYKMNAKNIKYLIDHHIDIEIDKSYSYIWNYLIRYYVFNNTFLIQLILLHKNQIPLSKRQFQEIILQEKRKLKLTRSTYNDIISHKDFKTLGKLLRYHHEDKEFFEALNRCCRRSSTYHSFYNYEYFDRELDIIYHDRLDILKLLIMNGFIIYKNPNPKFYHYEDILIQASCEKKYEIVKYLLGCLDSSKKIKIAKIRDAMSKIPFPIFKLLKQNNALYLNW